jgi:hypothetical protein
MGRSALQKATERAAASIACPVTFILMRRIASLCIEDIQDAHLYLTSVARKEGCRTRVDAINTKLVTVRRTI